MTSTLDAELSLRMYRAAQRLQGVFTDEDRGMDGWRKSLHIFTKISFLIQKS